MNKIFFETVGTSTDPQNRLMPIFNALGSTENLDFVLMTFYLNSKVKGNASHFMLLNMKKVISCCGPLLILASF